MELLSYIGTSFTPYNLIMAVAGVVIGITVGALPGFTPTMGIAILLPVTYTMNPASALILLGAIYCGAMYGGSITAVLINTPGTSAAAATAMDGYKMTLDGRAHEALTESAVASFWGGIVSVFALIFLAPPLAKIAFTFGPQEKFMMAMFGLTIIVSLTVNNLFKGLMMGCVGLLLACIGMDPVNGLARFTFGRTFLLGGIAMIPCVIGLFSITQVLSSLMNPIKDVDKSMIATFKNARPTLKDLFKYPWVYLRASVIGIIIGIIPGTGGDVASYVSHTFGRMISKHPEKFGNGLREGVAYCEAANNAVTGGTLIPTLTIGVPGNATTAVLLGGLTIHGLTPGYGLFTTNQHVIYPFILSLFIANIVMLIIGVFGAKRFALVSTTPQNFLCGCVLMLSIMGSYAIHGSVKDVYMMLAIGISGFFIIKTFRYSVVPIVLGLILGPIAEEGFSNALILNGNSVPAVFVSMTTRPVCILLFALIVISLSYSYYSYRKMNRNNAKRS